MDYDMVCGINTENRDLYSFMLWIWIYEYALPIHTEDRLTDRILRVFPPDNLRDGTLKLVKTNFFAFDTSLLGNLWHERTP
jgi:hypothetical protein